jgi:putative copper resistance protein D
VPDQQEVTREPLAPGDDFGTPAPADIAVRAEPAEPIPAASDSTGPSRRWQVGMVSVAIALITGCVAAALSAIVPARNLIPGLPDAGQLTTLTLPAVKGIFDLMAALTIGWLLAAAALAPPQRSGIFDVAGYRAMRAASLAAMVWAAAGLALVPLTLSDTQGRPLSQSLGADAVLTALGILDNMRAPAIAAVVAIIIAIAARSVLRPVWAFVLLGLALAALVPVALAGHAAQSGDHDLATDSMLYHLGGVTLWVGGLVAFLGLARQRARGLPVIARRYSALALVAFIAVAASGVINAWIRIPYLSDLWTTDYGRMVLAKSALLICLGGIGFLHRRRTLPSITDQGDARPLIRLAVVEVAIMAVTVGVAAALGRTATPPPSGAAPSDIALVLGFDLPGPPSIGNLLLFWRFDLVAGTGSLVAAALYLVGVARLRRRGDPWPAGRTLAWLLGCLTVLLATSSGVGAYAQAEFSMHMIMHMLLAMLAPILLVLGGPVTLILRALPAAGKGRPPGFREAVVGLVHSRLTRFLTHPLVVLPLFIASFYVLYFTGLFQTMISSHLGHLLMTVHFLVVGYLYYWVIIGVDPAPRRLSAPIKLAVLLAAMPFHAFFGLALMSSHQLIGADFYQRLALPWIGDLLSDQRLGGGIGWGFTEIPLLVVLIALMAQWARSDDRQSRRDDRRAEADDEADLRAYNAMLAAMAEHDGSRRD